jgi:hypothetical protein
LCVIIIIYEYRKNVPGNITWEQSEEVSMGYIKVKSTTCPARTYYVQCDIPVMPGDLVLYEAIGNQDGYGQENRHKPNYHVGRVEMIGQYQTTTTSHVVYKIDLAPYQRRKSRQAEIDKIRAQVAAMRTNFDDVAFLKSMADSDPQAADLLNRYNDLVTETRLPQRSVRDYESSLGCIE